jgi:hypothetical protein
MRDAFAEIERARSALWSLDPGCNAGEHFRLAAAFANGGGDFEEFNRWSERAHNYGSEGECRSVWKSASKPGSVTVATLFAAARAAGWTDGDEAPAKRPQSHQEKRQQPEASSTPPLHDPRAIWDACKPATIEQDYIERKRGLPDSLRTYDGPLTIAGNACAGSLVLPCSTLAGELVTLQFITPQGKKLFLPGCKLSPWPDACLIIGGPLKPDGAAYIVEGPGQAWSAHQATRAPAVVAFGVGRMAGIARALRQHYQAARLVVVPDVGKESQAAAIAKDVHGVWVELPRDLGQNGDLNDLHQRDGLPAVAALLERAKAHPQRFRLLTPDDLAALPPVRWRVRGVLPLEGIGAVFGPSGSGKSFLVLSLLAAVASGAEWFGCRVVRAPVLYVALEGEAGIPQRWKAYQAKHGRIADGLHFLLRTLDIRNATDRADLVQAVRAAGWNGGVLCLDTLNRAAPGMDENDSKSMGEAIGAAKAIQAELGGLVLLVHHTGKDATRGLRGHSSLHAALDAAIEVTRNNDRREWTVAKSKDGEDGAARPFRLDVVEIGEDEDGEPVTSCVVVPDENAGDAVRRVQIPKGGNARLVWDGLREMFKAACDRRPAGVPDELPIGRPVLSLEDAIAGTKGRLTCDSDQRGYRARLAITSLVNSGLLTLREGWLWIS